MKKTAINWEDFQKQNPVKTTAIKVVKFHDISTAHTFIEGEGDKSLDYWRKVYCEYYMDEMKLFGEYPTEDMEIVCEYFETIG